MRNHVETFYFIMAADITSSKIKIWEPIFRPKYLKNEAMPKADFYIFLNPRIEFYNMTANLILSQIKK